MAEILSELFPHQIAALFNKKPTVCLGGGVGSGKTEAGIAYSVIQSFTEPRSMGVIASNTYRQLQDSTLTRLLQRLDEWKIRHNMNWNRMVLTIGKNAPILCRTLTNWEKLAGIEIGWYYIDEGWGSPVDGFLELTRRMRCPKAKRLRGLITTNFNGFDWIYEEFWERPLADPKVRELRSLIRATTLDNPTLVRDYIKNLRSTLTKELLLQWVFAQFVNVNAKACYYNFDRRVNVNAEKAKFRPNLPLRFTMDFNYNPLCASVGQQLPDGSEAWTFTEYTQEYSSTYKLCQAFINDFKDFKGEIFVYGDSTGSKHHTSSKHTDWEIVMKLLKPVFGPRLKFKVPRRNPPVRDRLNSVNAMLKNAENKVRYYINPKCRKLIRDFEVTESVELDPSRIDKRDSNNKALTHPTDATGYWLTKEFPVKKPSYGGIVNPMPSPLQSNLIKQVKLLAA